MTDRDRLPVYNLKAVVQETGLKPDTLRAWERRYGLPEPQRTDSGHRLYTERDIQTLKWLKARLEEGLTISRAVALWHEVTRQGDDPAAHAAAVRRASPSGSPPANALSLPDQAASITGLMQDWIAACLRFDERSAEQVIQNAFAVFPPETVLLRLIQPALAQIGAGWYQGTVTVQQEHFASALAMRRLEALLASSPAPTRSGRVLVGCPPHEQHTFVPLMLTVLLRRRGWDVIYLGADVPLQSIDQTVEVAEPSLVILTAQQLHTAAGLLDMGRLLLNKRVPLAYGGSVFNDAPRLRKVIPGHFLGTQIDAAVDAVEAIMAAPRVHVAMTQVDAESEKALQLFREHRSQIEADLRYTLEHSGMPRANMAEANLAVGGSIEGALALGMIDDNASESEWLMSLLITHYQVPADIVPEYLRVYRQSVIRHMGAGGQLLTDWLDNLAQSDVYADGPDMGAVRHRQIGVQTKGRR